MSQNTTAPPREYRQYEPIEEFDIDGQEILTVRDLPSTFPIPIAETIEHWLARMDDLDAPTIWDEQIGDWETFCHTAERTLEDTLPLHNPPFKDCHCPNAVIENTAGFYNTEKDAQYIEAAVVWISDWLRMFCLSFSSQTAEAFEDLAEALTKAQNTDCLTDEGIATYIDYCLNSTDAATPNNTESTTASQTSRDHTVKRIR